MAFLTINGIQIFVEDKKASFGTVEVGDQSAALSGKTIGTRRALYRAWKMSLITQTQIDADFARNLVLGLGHHWSFDTDYFSSKGLGANSLTGNTISAAHAVKFGSDYAAVVTTVTFAGAAATQFGLLDWTVLVWKWNGASWDGWVVNSAGNKWLNGATSVAATAWLTVGGTGDVTLTTGDYDDLVVLPYLSRGSDNITWTTATSAFSDLPKLLVAGDAIGQKPNPATAYGTAGDMKFVQGSLGAGFVDNLETFDFTLAETS